MASNPKRIERDGCTQLLMQYQTYAKGTDDTPAYVYHGADEDRMMILCSQIKIWQPKGTDWFNIPSVNDEHCLVIREVSSIEITKSYKDIISTAVIKIPRGTVVERRNKDAIVIQGDEETGTENKNQTVSEATVNGDMLTVESAKYMEDGTPTASLAPNYDDKGLLDFNRTEQEAALLEPNDMAIGNRIEIRLGYAYSEEEYERIKISEGKDVNLSLVFTGFITGISVGTPLEIECENMAHLLTTFSIPRDITDKTPLTVKSFFSDDGKYKLLSGTGLELTNSTKECDIDVKGANVSKEMSIVDVVDQWRELGVMSYMVDSEDGTSRLRVARVYYSGKGGTGMPTDNVNYITYNNGDNTFVIIQADWDMASDDLNLMNTDKKYLAVEAQGKNKDGEWMKLTLIKRPDIDDDGWTTDKDGQFYVTNERGYTPKKRVKRTGGTKTKTKRTVKNADGSTTTYTSGSDGSSSTSTKSGNTRTTVSHSATGRTTRTTTTKNADGSTTTTTSSSGGVGSAKKAKKNKISMKRYNVVPYISTKIGVTRNELIEEAKQYWNSYVPNGIDGSISIFGDLDVQPAQIVGLVDQRQPEKNGYYLVESVDIEFGEGGYRKKIKLPYKLASFGGQVKVII